MFSIDESAALKRHQRRVTALIEATLPPSALEAGTSVAAMQVACNAPDCVPLETAVAIIFPRPPPPAGGGISGGAFPTPLVEGLEESRVGGSFRTRVLKPIADVTRDDVLDALPPQFEGGRRTMERACLRARDAMLGRISQLLGEDDGEGRALMAEYLRDCLSEYIERGCAAPEIGEPFLPVVVNGERISSGSVSVVAGENGDWKDEPSRGEGEGSDSGGGDGAGGGELSPGEGDDGWRGTRNIVVRRPLDDEDTDDGVKTRTASPPAPVPASLEAGNFVVQRPPHDEDDGEKTRTTAATVTDPPPPGGGAGKGKDPSTTENAMDWRRRRNMEASLRLRSSSAAGMGTSSRSVLQQLSEREHAPGIRRPGCPCCEPDGASAYADKMMMI